MASASLATRPSRSSSSCLTERYRFLLKPLSFQKICIASAVLFGYNLVGTTAAIAMIRHFRPPSNAALSLHEAQWRRRMRNDGIYHAEKRYTSGAKPRCGSPTFRLCMNDGGDNVSNEEDIDRNDHEIPEREKFVDNFKRVYTSGARGSRTPQFCMNDEGDNVSNEDVDRNDDHEIPEREKFVDLIKRSYTSVAKEDVDRNNDDREIPERERLVDLLQRADDECEGEFCMIPEEEHNEFSMRSGVTPGSSLADGQKDPDERTTGLDGGAIMWENIGVNQITAKQRRATRAIEDLLKWLPIVAPSIAYLSYEEVSAMLGLTLDVLSNNNWVAVDGGMYQTQIITPVINGIVVPSVSILFATLISNTFTTLRQRQLDIRTCLNTEATELRILQAMIDSFPTESAGGNIGGYFTKTNESDLMSLSAYQDKCRHYLTEYTNRIIAESQEGVKLDLLEFTGSIDSEINGLVVQLNELSGREHESRIMRTNPNLLSESYAAITRLNSERSARISALQSTFPPLQYAILALLAGSICVCFLIESSQAANIFLNQVQLKILWTILIGTFSALGTVLYDLIDPFRGSYQIASTKKQLFTIRDALKVSAQMKMEKGTGGGRQ